MASSYWSTVTNTISKSYKMVWYSRSFHSTFHHSTKRTYTLNTETDSQMFECVSACSFICTHSYTMPTPHKWQAGCPLADNGRISPPISAAPESRAWSALFFSAANSALYSSVCSAGQTGIIMRRGSGWGGTTTLVFASSVTFSSFVEVEVVVVVVVFNSRSVSVVAICCCNGVWRPTMFPPMAWLRVQ